MIQDIKLSDIHTDAYYEDAYYDNILMGDLKASILEVNIMTPITVTNTGTGKYLLVLGRKRFRVFKELGRDTIPCGVIPLTDEGIQLYRNANGDG